MGITFTSLESQALAEELARRLQSDVEQAVTEAMREKLEKTKSMELKSVRTPEEQAAMLRKIQAIVEEVSPLLKDLPDVNDYLYDDLGLPK